MSPTSGQGGVFMVVPLSPESPRLASDYCKEPGGPGYCCGCEGFIILAVACCLNHAFYEIARNSETRYDLHTEVYGTGKVHTHY